MSPLTRYEGAKRKPIDFYTHHGITVNGKEYTREDIEEIILGIAGQPGEKSRNFMLKEVSRQLYGRVLDFTDVVESNQLTLICDNAVLILKDAGKLANDRFSSLR